MIVEHFGHWKVLETPHIIEQDGLVDLSKYIGFVYVISFEDGTKYIGAKKIWKRIVKPPNTFKRGPNKGFEQSDWREYTSSSNAVNDKISNGIQPNEYLIVGFYDTWGKTLYAEALLQIQMNIFDHGENRVWLNHQIEGMFTKSCWDNVILENNTAYYNNYNSIKPLYNVFWNNVCIDVCLDGKEYIDQPMTDLMTYSDFMKLVEGKVDNMNGISLPRGVSRRDWKYKFNNKYYYTQSEMLDDLNISKQELLSLEGLVDNKIETRSVYVKRLAVNPINIKINRRYK